MSPRQRVRLVLVVSSGGTNFLPRSPPSEHSCSAQHQRGNKIRNRPREHEFSTLGVRSRSRNNARGHNAPWSAPTRVARSSDWQSYSMYCDRAQINDSMPAAAEYGGLDCRWPIAIHRIKGNLPRSPSYREGTTSGFPCSVSSPRGDALQINTIQRSIMFATSTTVIRAPSVSTATTRRSAGVCNAFQGSWRPGADLPKRTCGLYLSMWLFVLILGRGARGTGGVG